MSFILDALRKSEHERQRSALPGLAHVPLATPTVVLPRWALVVIGLLAATVLVLGGAWWQSLRTPLVGPTNVERSVPLPPPAATLVTPSRASPPATVAAPAENTATPVERAAAPPPAASLAATVLSPTVEPAKPTARRDEPALPSAAALAAQGVPLPPLRLELHAFAEQPSARFVFINGRKYVEGERMPEGPQVVAIQPTGAVLRYAGQTFLLVAE